MSIVKDGLQDKDANLTKVANDLARDCKCSSIDRNRIISIAILLFGIVGIGFIGIVGFIFIYRLYESYIELMSNIIGRIIEEISDIEEFNTILINLSTDGLKITDSILKLIGDLGL